MTLQAVPAPGYEFVGWQGACNGAGDGAGDCALVMTPQAEPVQVTAVFELVMADRLQVAGRAIGLRGRVELALGEQRLSVAADGRFQFPQGLPSGVRYHVSIESQPDNQLCALNNAAGKIATADIANVYLSCADRSPHHPNPFITIEDDRSEPLVFQPQLPLGESCAWSRISWGIEEPLHNHTNELVWEAPLRDANHVYSVRCELESGAQVTWTVRPDDAVETDVRISNANDVVRFWNEYDHAAVSDQGLDRVLDKVLYIAYTPFVDLGFLEGLTALNQSLKLIENRYLESLSGLEALTVIGQSLTIENAPRLPSLHGLDKLHTIGTHLEVADAPLLTSLAGLESLRRLEGRFELDRSNAALTSIVALNRIEHIGSLEVSRGAALDGFELMPSATLGSLVLAGSDIASLASFRHLTALGSLSLYSTSALDSLAGFEQLTQLDRLYLRGSFGFAPFTGVPGVLEMDELRLDATDLTAVELQSLQHLRSFRAEANSELTFLGLGSLQSLGTRDHVVRNSDGLSVHDNTALMTLDLGDVATVEGDVSLRRNALVAVDGAGNLQSVSGELLLGGQGWRNLAGLARLQTVGALRLWGMTGFASFGALEQVGSLTITDAKTDDLSGFAETLDITGAIYIGGNDTLKSLTGLPLPNQLWSLSIEQNPKLTDVSTLAAVSRVERRVIVTENAALCTSEVLRLLQPIELPEFLPPTIDANADC